MNHLLVSCLKQCVWTCWYIKGMPYKKKKKYEPSMLENAKGSCHSYINYPLSIVLPDFTDLI